MLPALGFSTTLVIVATRSPGRISRVSTMPKLPTSAAGTSITPMVETFSRVATSTICFMTGTSASMRSSARITAKGSSPTTGAAHSTAWPRPNASDCRM